MNERDMEHGKDWNGQDVAGWWASEKLDGCRAYWDGDRLWTRSGRAIELPAQLARQLPATHLDGEIYAGVGGRDVAATALRLNRWLPNIRFAVFDAPLVEGDWSKRMAVARTMLVRGPFAYAVGSVKVRDSEHLAQLYCDVKKRDGEGLILRWPESRCYHAARSSQILKLKRDPRPWWQRLLAA